MGCEQRLNGTCHPFVPVRVHKITRMDVYRIDTQTIAAMVHVSGVSGSYNRWNKTTTNVDRV